MKKGTKVDVSAALLKEIYEAADTPQSVKARIERTCPEVVPPKVFKFGQNHTITLCGDDNHPLMIGFGIAPSGLEEKCLVVTEGWNMKVLKQHGMTVLTFEKK